MPWTQPQLWTTEVIGFARQLGPCSLRHVFLGSGPFRPHFYDDLFLLQMHTQSVCPRSYDKQPLSTGRFPGLRSIAEDAQVGRTMEGSFTTRVWSRYVPRPGQASENRHSIGDCCNTMENLIERIVHEKEPITIQVRQRNLQKTHRNNHYNIS